MNYFIMFKKYISQKFANDIHRIYPLLTPQLRWRSFGIFIFMIVQSLLELFFILSLTDMSLALTNPDAVRSSLMYRAIFHIFPYTQELTTNPKFLLLLVGCVVVIINILKNIINYFTAHGIAYLGEDISLGVGQEIMSRYLYQDYAWHLSPDSANMYHRMLWRGSLAGMLTQALTLYATVLTVLILFFSLVGAEPVLTTMIITITSFIGFLLFKSIRRKVDSSAHESKESAKEETDALLCATKGIREVLIYRQQETFLQALMNAALKGRTPRTYSGIAPTLPTWTLEAVGFAMVVVAIAFLVFVEDAGMARISAAISLLVLTAWRVLPYCNRVVSLQIGIRSLRPMAYAVIELLESLRTLPSNPPPKPAKDFTFTQEISLNSISFRYANATTNSLNDITFTLKKGEKIGIIGKSGGGKTTLAGVLSGLLPSTSGHISIDGVPLNESRRAAFVQHIGYVPQAPFLFAGTLAENIAFSDWGKKWSEEKIHKACKQAAIDFVDTHEKGILRPIGENGAGLSGGQAQRVSIARAMYTQPSLLIFDEATSALDQHNEKAIQDTIENLADKVTCIIIAHRLSTVASCDRVIWLNQGQIIMDDSPEKVIAQYSAAHTNEEQ